MNKKDKTDQEEKNEWFANQSTDPKKVDDMFKNSPKSEGEMGMEGCLIGFSNKEDDYEGDGTEWIYEQDEDGKLYRRKMGSQKGKRIK